MNFAFSSRSISSYDQRPASWLYTANSTLRTSKVAAKANTNSCNQGGTNTTIRLRGSRKMLNTSLINCARKRVKLKTLPMAYTSRFLRVARLAKIKKNVPIAAIASRFGQNTAQISPAKNTVFNDETK